MVLQMSYIYIEQLMSEDVAQPLVLNDSCCTDATDVTPFLFLIVYVVVHISSSALSAELKTLFLFCSNSNKPTD